jgi:Putative peptidoglycan binding domain
MSVLKSEAQSPPEDVQDLASSDAARNGRNSMKHTTVGDIPLRRVIRLGDRGNDVLAVRRALSVAGLFKWPQGGFSQPWHRNYGPAMWRTVRRFQGQNGLGIDGKYGKETHKKLRRHFDSFGAMLMRSFKPDAATGRVSKTATADRPGVSTRPQVIAFLERVAGVWGHPIVITTGTNHPKMTISGNISEHWDGRAADVAESGDDLTRLGQAALITAGWSPARARRAFGDLYNVHRGGRRYQIIFNTTTGGNHWNHLHVGIRGI